jgi:hypothetical protein
MTNNLTQLLESLVEEMVTEAANDSDGGKSKMSYEEALSAAQNPETDDRMLAHIFRDYGGSLDMARAVAVHPNTGSHNLQILFMFMPDEVKKNPSYDVISSEGQWQRNIRYLQRSKLKGKASGWDAYAVSAKNPALYKAAFYLENGAPEDFGYVVSLKNVPNKLLRPYLKNKNSNKRKLLAQRQILDAEDYELLAGDSAKTVRLALASNPSLPTSVFEKLLNDKDDAVRHAAASNAQCPPELAHTAKMGEAAKPKLADKAVGNLSADEICALLQDPETSAERLDELASGAEPHVRYACGLHPNASPEFCKALLKDEPAWLAEAVAWNPSAPSELLQKLSKNAPAGVLTGLAHNPSTPEAVQLELAESGTNEQRYGLANSTEFASVWTKLAANGDVTKQKKDQEWEDHLAIVLDPKSSASKLRGIQKWWEGRHTFVGRLIARHPNCPPSLVSQYAYYCYPELAHNPKFALQILENPDVIRGEPVKAWLLSEWVSTNGVPGHIANFYLQSDDEKNRRRAAANHRASMRLLQPMTLDADTKLRSALAARNDLTRFMFEVLARDKNNKTREIVAKNKHCPAEVLSLLATDKTAAVRAGATQNRNFEAGGNAIGKAVKIEPLHDRGPLKDRIKMAKEARKAAVLADLAQDQDADVREAVADNERTKGDVLAVLAGDSEPRVRRRIPYQKATPVEVRSRLLDDDDIDVRYAAFNSSMHWANHFKKDAELAELVSRAINDSEVEIRAIAAEFAADSTTQQKLADEDHKSIQRKLARNPNLALSVAKRLVTCEDNNVREKVLRDIADLDTIRQVLNNPDDKAIRAATCNPLVLEHATEFVDHPDAEVRAHLAYEIDNLPDAIFDSLVKDPERRVQEYLAKAKKLNRERIEMLVDIACPDALWELSARNKLKDEDVLRCANHSDASVREIVASNHAMSDEVFERFLQDEPEVRDALTHNKCLTKSQKAKVKEEG